MPPETAQESFQIDRHGEIAVVTPSAKVEEMHETMIEQAARLVVQALREDMPDGIVIDLSQVNYFGSVFVSFLLRCHSLAKKSGSVKICPMPIKRSRVFTRQAIMSENVEKQAAPSMTMTNTPSKFNGFQFICTPKSRASTYTIAACVNPRNPAESALPRTSAARGVGLARNL